MNRQQQIQYCATCKNRTFHNQYGQVCGLTNLVPQIENQCTDYLIDEKEEQVLIEREIVNDDKNHDRKIWFRAIVGMIILLYVAIKYIILLSR